MLNKTYRTNLNCESCISAVTPFLNGEPSVKTWGVDLDDPRKLLSVSGESLDEAAIRSAVEKSGFQVFEEITLPKTDLITTQEKSFGTYYPLFLIFIYLLGFVSINAYVSGELNSMSLMNHFMGGFFVVFSFFKILNLKGFADSYVTYDVVAKKIKAYAFVYPFIELSLGMAYLAAWNLFFTNLTTILVMGVSSVGVVQSLMKKQKIRCACLGTFFELPMSTVSLIEDLLMLGMAAFAVIAT